MNINVGYIVTKEEIADNLYKSSAFDRAESLAFSMRQTKENVGANVYNRAVDSNYVGADGLELLSTAHLLATGGTMEACARLAERCGAEVVGYAFLVELDFLNGRDRLAPHEVFSLIHYDGEE